MLSERIYYLYQDALDIGIPIERFWNSSLAEVLDMLESHKRVRQYQTKEKLLFIYQLSEWTADHIMSKWDKDYPVPHPWDTYPDLFQEEQALFEESRQRQEFEAFKERRRQYYEYKNHQRASE